MPERTVWVCDKCEDVSEVHDSSPEGWKRLYDYEPWTLCPDCYIRWERTKVDAHNARASVFREFLEDMYDEETLAAMLKNRYSASSYEYKKLQGEYTKLCHDLHMALDPPPRCDACLGKGKIRYRNEECQKCKGVGYLDRKEK